MTSSDFVAGHPIAIRVGGRRLSQSHPTKASPTKANTGGSPSTSPEDAHVGEPEPTPDYPRPISRPVNASTGGEGGDTTNLGEQQASPNGSSEEAHNRKERRRRQEKKKDKYQTEEDKMHGLPRNFPDVRSSTLSKEGRISNDKGRRSSASTGGIRITQPASKFMA